MVFECNCGKLAVWDGEWSCLDCLSAKTSKLLKELADFKPELPIGFYLADARRARYGDTDIL